MKILLACQQSPRTHPLPAYGFWRHYFVSGLREAGHEVFEVPDADWARGLLPLDPAERARWRDQQWSRTLSYAKTIPGLELFLGYLYPRQIEVSGVQALAKFGVPTVNFFCDNVREYRRLPSEFAPFDLHWVPEQAALPLYAAPGWRTLSAPMPCWIPPSLRHVGEKNTEMVAFIGRRDPLRKTLLAQVARTGLPLTIYGPGWKKSESVDQPAPLRPTWSARRDDWLDFYRRQGAGPTWRRLTRSRRPQPGESFDFTPWAQGTLDEADYGKITAGSAVTLGINRCPAPDGASPHLVYSRLRDIEAPMLGACYLTEWAPELPRLYDIGHEIEVYRNADELVSVAQALLADPARQKRMRLAAFQRAHREHSIAATLKKIAAYFGR